MKASELINLVQKEIDKNGDKDIVVAHDGVGYDFLKTVHFMFCEGGDLDDNQPPNCFVLETLT